MNGRFELNTAVSLLISAYANMERAMNMLNDLGIKVCTCERSNVALEDHGRNVVLLSSGMKTLSAIVDEAPAEIYSGSYGKINISGIDFLQQKKTVRMYEDDYE